MYQVRQGLSQTPKLTELTTSLLQGLCLYWLNGEIIESLHASQVFKWVLGIPAMPSCLHLYLLSHPPCRLLLFFIETSSYYICLLYSSKLVPNLGPSCFSLQIDEITSVHLHACHIFYSSKLQGIFNNRLLPLIYCYP